MTRKTRAKPVKAVKPPKPLTQADVAAAASEASKVERIEHIAELIAAGHYRSNLTPRELAKRWDVKETTVREYAHSASLILRFGKERREELQTIHANLLENIIYEARQMSSTQTGIPDWRHVLGGWELFQKYVLGNYAKPEAEGLNPVELSDEDLQRLAADALKFVSKAIEPKSSKQEPRAGD